MRREVVGKPHIYFSGGYWRVSPWDRNKATLQLWVAANKHACKLNAADPEEL